MRLLFVLSALSACNTYHLICHDSLPAGPLGSPPVAEATRSLAFVFNPDGVNHLHLMRIDAAGKVVTSSRLTADAEPENNPEWSPDGQRIVYQRDLDGAAIYVVGVDGKNPVRLSGTPGQDVFPNWSPDGSQIVYVHLQSAPQPNRPPITELHIADANGCNDRVVFTSRFAVEPRWSVTNRIVFMSMMNGPLLDVYTIDPSGKDLQRLTENQGNNGDPVWSPDGSKISFGSDREGGDKLNLFVMNADGSTPVQLTHAEIPEETGDSNWSSDGTKITFQHDVDGKKQSDPAAFAEVWTMNADGTEQLSTGQRCSNVGCAPRFAPTR